MTAKCYCTHLIKKSPLKDWVTVWLWTCVVQKVFKNTSSHSCCCEFVLFVCLTGRRFACGSPLSDCNSERTATAEQENFIVYSPCLRVCMCVLERERERERFKGSCNQSSLSGHSSLASSLPSSLSATGLFSDSVPFGACSFSSTSRPLRISLSPSHRTAALSWLACCYCKGRREQGEEEKERDRPIDHSDSEERSTWIEKARQQQLFLYTFLLQRIFCDSYYSLLKHLNHVLPLEKEDS